MPNSRRLRLGCLSALLAATACHAFTTRENFYHGLVVSMPRSYDGLVTGWSSKHQTMEECIVWMNKAIADAKKVYELSHTVSGACRAS